MDCRELSSSRIARMVAAVLTMVVASGCASLRGAPDWPATTTLEESDPHYAHALKAYHDAKDPDARKSIRDAFIETRVGQMDRTYGEYKQTIYSQRVGSAVGVDIATLALSAVGAAVSEAGTKTITSALSGGLIGSKASIDKNVYFDRTLPALLAQMDGMRAQLRAQLLDGMLVGTERYPLMQAAADLAAYFDAGTITGAIANITTQAATEQRAADNKLKARLPSEREVTMRLERMGFKVERVVDSPTSLALQRCVDGGRLKPALDAWLRKQPEFDPAEPFPVTDFIAGEQKESLRKRALADATLKPTFATCS